MVSGSFRQRTKGGRGASREVISMRKTQETVITASLRSDYGVSGITGTGVRLHSGMGVQNHWNRQSPRDWYSSRMFHAASSRRPAKGLIHHSDRGSQYCSRRYSKTLALFGMRASMSRKGNCYDNVPMESFWGPLKNELIHHRRYATRAEAMGEIREYIEIFYNRQRRQKRLGNLSPAAFERRYYEQQRAA